MEDDIQVTMVEPGAVETPLTERTMDEEAQEGIRALYQLDLLPPEDIAIAIANCVSRPERVSVNEILIRLTQQANQPTGVDRLKPRRE